MVRLVYEIHSTTTDNEAGVATGWNGGRLSTAGEARARELCERRRGPLPAAVFASDLERAVRTAQIAYELR
jgi:alpha-ribazole phosphatase/probable phosphoglycerate mutase